MHRPHDPASSPHTLWLHLIALLGIAWTAVGTYDLTKAIRFGYASTPTGVVTAVSPGSPAERGGLAVDDRIMSIGGVAFDDTTGQQRRPRPRIGENVPFEVARNGVPQRLTLVAGALPSMAKHTAALNGVIGLLFAGGGLLAWWRASAPSTPLFAWLGVCALWVFPSAPRLPVPSLRAFFPWVVYVLVLLAAALFVHFTLTFPRAGRIARRGWPVTALYVTVAVGLIAALTTLLPPLRSLGQAFVNVLAPWQPRLFLLLGIAALTASFVRATPDQRRSSGLGIMLAGTILAVVPFLTLTILALVNPSLPITPSIAGLPLLLLPVALTWGVLRHEQPTPIG